MSDARSHYEVLGCSAEDSVADLRRAYLRLARRHHPDFHSGSPLRVRREAEATMQRINEAWHEVSDPARRASYDAALNGQRGRGGSGAASGAPHDVWHAFDDGPDTFDADDFDDTPVDGASTLPPLLTVMPILLLLAAALVLGAALLLDERSLVAAAALLAGVGVAGFVVVPLIALTRSRRGARLD